MMTFSRAARSFVCFLLVAISLVSSPGFVGANVIPSRGEVAWKQLLPPGQNPDDDGDGIEDEDDPEPNDPGVAPTPPVNITSPDQDSDGDGLPNVQDPDDDNAGVSDQDDPAPFDPGIEPTPVPDHLSPIHDDDGDGIPNIQDPDDDNDGLPDDEDAGEPDAVAPGGTGSGDRGYDSAGGNNAPVVTKLPVTGVGDTGTVSPVTWTLIAFATGLVVVTVRNTILRLRHIGRR